MHARSRATRSSKAAADRLLTVAFLGFITLPFVGTFWGWDVYEVQENRRLTSFPDMATTSIAELPEALDDYYRDHFGFRNFLIRRWNRLQRRLDKGLLRQVIAGRDGWLYYDRPDVMLDYLGRAETTEEDLEYWRRAIEGRRAWLAERGIRYLFGVAPNKVSVYPEMLPEDLREAGKTTRLDLLVRHMAARSDVRILDLRPALRANKAWKPLYYKNDTHWSCHGVYVAYRAVVDRLRQFIPELAPPLELSDCRIRTEPYYGDLARLADLPRSEYTLPCDVIEPPTLADFEITPLQDPVFAPDRVWPVDHQPPPVYRCWTGRGRALVFHDSFFLTGTKLLAHHFEESTCIWHELLPEALTAAVERQKPDVVVEVIAERMLYRLPEQSRTWEEARKRLHSAKPLE